jgi:hypothetical protein
VAPEALALAALLLDRVSATVAPASDRDHLRRARRLISDLGDADIVAAAWQTACDFIVTLDRQHILENMGLAAGVPFRIGTPGDAPAWIRERFAECSGTW